MSYSNLLCKYILGVVLISSLISLSSSQLIFKKGVPNVKLNQRFYSGSVKSTRQGGDKGGYYYEFLGLRYANPPKRFQPPEPLSEPETVVEVKRADKPGPKCPQQFGPEVTGDEDCLYLNVFVPMRKSPTKDGFSTMVWIHGGAFTFSSGDSYEPQYFLDEDVILVTLNYRLGAFGFLSTGDEIVPGNMGCKDVAVALKWIKENIEHFGGDNKRVTIFGNSAGASMVHYLILSPMSRGLFQNAIAQSGSVNSFWAFSKNPASSAQELGQMLKCNTDNSKALLECLESKTTAEIISAQSILKRWFVDPIALFVPTVEISGSDNAFLSEDPEAIIEKKEFARVPLMIGFTQDEGLSVSSVGVITSDKLRFQLDSDFLTLAPITFNYRDWFPTENLNKVSEEIRKYYFQDKKIDLDTMQNLTNLYSDVNFVYGVWKFALSHATEKPVYPYVISFQDESSSSITKLFTGSDKKYGVAHGDEIQYLFKSKLFSQEVPKDSEAEIFSKRLVKLWASFAQHRKPTETWGSATKWPSISKAQLEGNKPIKWYQLDKDTKIIEEPFIERKKFWDKLFKRYSKISQEYKDEL